LNAGASSPPLACFYSATLAWNLSAVDSAIADVPDHLIHFNRDQFFGPQKR
jgi:hypothetical protein